MATGDQSDIVARLKSTLPLWFTDSTPILDGVLAGWATTWVFVYSLLSYARLQSRIATASDGWLDMIAGDFFGLSQQRRPLQTDQSYRVTIQANIFRDRGTRNSIVKVLTDVTGRVPVVIELTHPLDTGAYGALYGYGAIGAYGSMASSFVFFVRAYRPLPGSPQYGISDTDIYAAINSVQPVCSTAWVNLSN